MPSVERLHQELSSQFAQMRTLVGRGDAVLLEAKTATSGWCPAEHLDHVLKATNAILDGLKAGKPLENPRPLSLIGRVLLTIGRIPRGKAKSPERIRGTRCDASQLVAAITRAEQTLAELDVEAMKRSRERIIPHPRFGALTPARALRFAAMHNDHHLRIIADILR